MTGGEGATFAAQDDRTNLRIPLRLLHGVIDLGDHVFAQQVEVVRAVHHGGGCWYPLAIRRLLMNEAYMGRTVYRSTIMEGPGEHRCDSK